MAYMLNHMLSLLLLPYLPGQQEQGDDKKQVM